MLARKASLAGQGRYDSQHCFRKKMRADLAALPMAPHFGMHFVGDGTMGCCAAVHERYGFFRELIYRKAGDFSFPLDKSR